MGNDSSSQSNNCDHNWNSDDRRYDHHEKDSIATIHYKNEHNEALDRVETFGPSGDTQAEEAVINFRDGYILTHAKENVAEGCGKCKDNKSADEEDNNNDTQQ